MRAARAGDFGGDAGAGDGYFWLKWTLVVDRSHLMADDAPFLFPVVIDDTTDATARVNEGKK